MAYAAAYMIIPEPVVVLFYFLNFDWRKKMLVNLSIQVIPTVPEKDIYYVVDRVIERIEKSGLKYEVGPMETTIEGELSELLEIVKEAQEICVKYGAERVCTVVKIDYKPEGVTIDEKIGKYRK